MPGTPDPAIRAGEGDSGDTALREATSRRWRRERCERRMLGDGVAALFSAKLAPFSELALGRKRAWQSLGTGDLPAGCGGVGQDGCTGKGAGLSLASSS